MVSGDDGGGGELGAGLVHSVGQTLSGGGRGGEGSGQRAGGHTAASCACWPGDSRENCLQRRCCWLAAAAGPAPAALCASGPAAPDAAGTVRL